MLILESALVAILATRQLPPRTHPAAPPPPIAGAGSNSEIAAAIKSDLESIAGPGAVEVNVVRGSLFNVLIDVPGFGSEFCGEIYERELKLYRLFPGLNFDFYLRLSKQSLAAAQK